MNIEQIIQKTDLVDLVCKAGGEVDTRSMRCACPIHGSHDANSFHIYTDGGKQRWKCFSGECGGGDAIDFVRVWRGWDFKRAYEFLGGDTQSDPAEMKRLADERHARALAEYEDKQRRLEAARRELQVAELHLRYHDNMKGWAREMWTARGLDEGMQDFWTLGACEDFTINGDYHTPTLTIPIFSEDMELLNIKHRLVNPQKPNDKYRPERSGMGAFPPLLAVPSMGYDGDVILVMEGEIKAMVTWTQVPSMDIQCIGVPGRSQFKALVDRLKGKNVIAIPDPGAEKDALDFARAVGGRYIAPPDKIDDYIISSGMTSAGMSALIKQARRV